MANIILRPYSAPYRAGYGPSAIAYHDLKCPRNPYLGRTLLAVSVDRKATLNVQFRRLRAIPSILVPNSNFYKPAKLRAIPFDKMARLLAYTGVPVESSSVSHQYDVGLLSSKARNCTTLHNLKGSHLAKGIHPAIALNPSNVISF